MNARQAKTKAKNDMALNLSELAAMSGYGLSSLKAMKLPLICGKIRLRDFWRVIQRRQSESITKASASLAVTDQTIRAADKFHAQRSLNGPPGASPYRAGSSVRSTV